jgi:hypothetical protein
LDDEEQENERNKSKRKSIYNSPSLDLIEELSCDEKLPVKSISKCSNTIRKQADCQENERKSRLSISDLFEEETPKKFLNNQLKSPSIDSIEEIDMKGCKTDLNKRKSRSSLVDILLEENHLKQTISRETKLKDLFEDIGNDQLNQNSEQAQSIQEKNRSSKIVSIADLFYEESDAGEREKLPIDEKIHPELIEDAFNRTEVSKNRRELSKKVYTSHSFVDNILQESTQRPQRNSFFYLTPKHKEYSSEFEIDEEIKCSQMAKRPQPQQTRAGLNDACVYEIDELLSESEQTRQKPLFKNRRDLKKQVKNVDEILSDEERSPTSRQKKSDKRTEILSISASNLSLEECEIESSSSATLHEQAEIAENDSWLSNCNPLSNHDLNKTGGSKWLKEIRASNSKTIESDVQATTTTNKQSSSMFFTLKSFLPGNFENDMRKKKQKLIK